MTTNIKNYRRAAMWILLSPFLFIMAAISTVESLTTYYVQLICFSVASVVGIVTGMGFIFNWSWAEVTAKYLFWLIAIYFVGSWILIALLLVYKQITVV